MKRLHIRTLGNRFLKLTVLGMIAAGSACCAQSSEDRALEAVRGVLRGSVRNACDQLAFALKLDPQSTSLHRAAGAALLLGGQTTGAEREFRAVLKVQPGDSVSIYGLGLCSAVRGSWLPARDRFEQAMLGGDRTVCLVALRFLDHVEGLKGLKSEPAVPDSLASTAQALGAVARYTSGDYAGALAAADTALKALPGEQFREPSALLIDFRNRLPLRSGAETAQPGVELGRPQTSPRQVYSGTIRLTPDDTPPAGSFIGFRIDGRSGFVTNQPPYTYHWDTTQAANGEHRIEIVVQNSVGQPVSRSERVVYTWNAGQSSTPREAATEAETIRLLWQALTLRPSRAGMAYIAGLSARRLGRNDIVERRFELCRAVDPLFNESLARADLLASRRGGTSVWRGKNEPLVALTFDDGPYAGTTEQILKVLTENRVTATFFVIGRHVTFRPDLTRMLAQAGMQVENHSYTHPNLNTLNAENVAAELLRTREAIREACGQDSRYFRPPGGNMNSTVAGIARKYGLTACMWTVDGDSLEYGSPDRLVDFVVKKAKPGSIILLHNGRSTTVEALPKIVEGLRRRGFGFARVDELLDTAGSGASVTPKSP